MNNRSKNRKNSGFTLIEMIVTVAIVAIFASIAVPSFSQLIQRNKETTTTNELISSLVLARSEALKRSRNVMVCSSNNQSTCNGGTDFASGWIVYADCDDNNALTAGNVDCNDDGAADVGEVELIKVHNGFNKMFISNAAASIIFQFSGRIAAPTTFNVAHDSDTSDIKKQVVINRVGRIRSE